MKPEAVLALEDLNLRKISKACNFRDCPRLPSKQAVLLEISGSGKKEIADLYFCEKHFASQIDRILEALEPHKEKGTALEKKVFDIGYVTC